MRFPFRLAGLALALWVLHQPKVGSWLDQQRPIPQGLLIGITLVTAANTFSFLPDPILWLLGTAGGLMVFRDLGKAIGERRKAKG